MLKNDYMKEVENTLKLVREEVDKNIMNGEIDEAKARINKELKGLVGLDINTIDLFSFEGISEIISKGQEFNNEKYLALAELLFMEGLICESTGDENNKITYYEKSIESFYRVYEDDDTINEKYLEDAVSIATELSRYNLSLEMDKKILTIYELNNNYDKAEDTLFYMLRKTNNDKLIILEGLKFYNRLKKLDADVLSEGNLPIDEVEDGLEELQKRLGI